MVQLISQCRTTLWHVVRLAWLISIPWCLHSILCLSKESTHHYLIGWPLLLVDKILCALTWFHSNDLGSHFRHCRLLYNVLQRVANSKLLLRLLVLRWVTCFPTVVAKRVFLLAVGIGPCKTYSKSSDGLLVRWRN